MKATITLSGIVAVLTLLVPGPSAASVPSVLNFSGRLGTDAGDFTGAATLVGTLYDGPASQPLALALWTESQEVYVDQGRFHMLLGADPSNPLPDDLVNAPELYIGIAVGDDEEMVPRMRLVSVPFALRSGDAATLSGQGPDDFSSADHGHDFFDLSGALGETQLPTSVVLDAELTAGLATKADLSHDHDDAYVNEGQAGSVDGAMVLDRSLTLVDLGDSGCGDQQVAKWDIGTQTWVCADDANTDNDTTYTAGSGLTLAGTEFSVDQVTVEAWAQAVCYDTPEELTAVLGGTYATLGHSHDDTYYTEIETDALLMTYAPAIHTHDDLYYGKTAVDTSLAGKSDLGHHHDDLYFRETEVNTALDGKSDVGHAHNSLYYTEGEVDALLSGYLTSYTETDPVYAASAAGGILADNIVNWNLAHGWGDHASAGYLTGYSETDPTFQTSAAYGIAGSDITDWDTAYGWGDHASAGYMTVYSETDPTFQTSAAYGIAGSDITNWDTAYGWGDHASAGYLTVYSETDPIYGAAPASTILADDITNWDAAYGWGDHSSGGYLTSYTETDPIYGAAPASAILAGDITNWDTAYGWGDHSSGGYLTSYTETDPQVGNNTQNYLSRWSGSALVTGSVYDDGVNVGLGTTNVVTHRLNVNGTIGATGGTSTQWNTAYGWGNHSTEGYLKSFTENDPQVGANATGYLPRWNGSALVSGAIYDNGTNVGIGTTNVAAYRLSVTGNLNASGTISASGGNSTQWNTAVADALKWDGGATGLNAATARTSLGLGNLAVLSVVIGGTGGTIQDGSITFADLDDNGCSADEVMQFDGSNWDCATLSFSNATTLDSLDSTQFLRSDASDTYSSGTLSLASGTTLDVNGSLALPTTGITGAGTGSGLDADLLDGQHATAFATAGHDHDTQYVPLAPTQHYSTNVITTLDSTGTYAGMEQDITIGTDGYPVVSYRWYNTSNDIEVRVAKCQNNSCTSATINTVDDGGYFNGPDNEIAIGSDGYPVIVHYYYPNFGGGSEGLRFVKCGNADCSVVSTAAHVQTDGIDGNSPGQAPTVIIGTDGLPIMAFAEGNTTRNLQILHCGNLSCSSGNTVKSVTSGGGWTNSFGIGVDGMPVIAGHSNGSNSCRFTTCADVACASASQTTVYNSTIVTGTAVRTTIGPDGLPVIAFYENSNKTIQFTKCGNKSCTSGNVTNTVVAAGSVAMPLDMTLSSDGLPLIVYSHGPDYDQRKLHVLKCGSADCTTNNNDVIVDSSSYVGGSDVSVTLGTDGNPVIAYDDYTTSALKVLKCANPWCVSGWTRR